MNRSSLPYSAQDLFPKAPIGNGNNVAGSSSILGGSRTIGMAHNSTSTPSSSSAFAATASNSATSPIRRLQKFLRRLFRPSSLDFETAIWEIFHLVLNPKKMYRSHYYRLQGKASYTRDDPAFLILLTGFLSLLAIAWGLAYSPRMADVIKLVGYMVVVDFYLTGAVIATLMWVVTNRVFNGSFAMVLPILSQQSHARLRVNYIDWGFCFDVHCNAFVVIWGLLYVVQFFLLPLLNVKRSFIALFFGNTLYFGAIGHYFVITFYGYNLLPFVSGGIGARQLQTIVLMGVLPALAIAWLLSICLGLNVAHLMVETYFN